MTVLVFKQKLFDQTHSPPGCICQCLLILPFLSPACPGTVNYTTSQTISSHDYPTPYPQGVRCTWVWQADSGLWGVDFTDVDLNENDYLTIDVGNRYVSVPWAWGSHLIGRLYGQRDRVRLFTPERSILNTRNNSIMPGLFKYVFLTKYIMSRDTYVITQHFSRVLPKVVKFRAKSNFQK